MTPPVSPSRRFFADSGSERAEKPFVGRATKAFPFLRPFPIGVLCPKNNGFRVALIKKSPPERF